MRVAIAGGGIAGLACAIALARENISVELFERASVLQEIGAGIQLAPNAMAVLDRVGVLGDLKPFLIEPRAVEIYDAPSGSHLTSIPLSERARNRYDSPYCVIHRADLQAGLLAAVRRHRSVTLVLGAEVNAVGESEGSIGFRAGGARRNADILVAADGVRSSLRTGHFGYSGAASIGHAAWRGMVRMTEVPSSITRDAIGLWLGAGAHLVHYPVAGGATLNVVIIARGDAVGYHPPLVPFGSVARILIDAVRAWTVWPLAVADTAKPWVRGHAVLVGDAAHAMAPSAAQGGAQAIEDAWVLARSLASSPKNPLEALAAYERVRRPRVEAIVREARRNLAIYDLAGLPAAARNVVLRMAPTAWLLSRLDWLFRWKSERSG
jgi:salicylate hydroxylase